MLTSTMQPKQRREFVYLILAGIFITNALLANIIGGKLFQFTIFGLGPLTMTLGVICWPIVFVTSDLVNEYFGKAGVRNLTLYTAGLIVYMSIVLSIGMKIPAASFSPVSDVNFNVVFGQSLWITVASLIAFLVSQLVDVLVFWAVRARTKGKLLWMRATGSTIVSQVIDTWVILGIAFYLPSALGMTETPITFNQYMVMCLTNYFVKLIAAVGLTPAIYAGHAVVDKMLGGSESKHLIDQAAKDSLLK